MAHRYLIVGAGGSGRRAYAILKLLATEDTCLKVLNTSQQTPIQDSIFDEGSVLEDIHEAVQFNPQGVFIAVPTSKHIAYAEMFLGLSEFIIIDKPLDSDLLRCERFVRNCHYSNTRVFVNFQRRYLKCWNMLKQELSLKRDGRFEYGSIVIQSYYPDWRREKPAEALYASRKDLGGGVLLTECHEIDIVQWLFGNVTRVSCTAEQSKDKQVENYAQLLLSVATEGRDCSVSLAVNDLSKDEQRTAVFHFEKATYILDELKGTVHRRDENGTRLLYDCPEDMLDAHTMLIKSVLLGSGSPPSVEDGLAVNAVIHAAKRSSQTHCTVEVNHTVCPGEGADFLELAIAKLQACFGEKLLAVYGLGSLGYGGYVDGWSDFDIDALISCDYSEAEQAFQSGKAIEREIIDAGFDRIDIRVYNPKHLNERNTILSYGQCSRACMLCDSAILLAGKKQSVRRPTVEECNTEALGLIEKMLSFPDEWWQSLPWDDIAAHFALVARFYYTSDSGMVAGKKKALMYFLEHYSVNLDNNQLRWMLWALSLRIKHESVFLQELLHREAVQSLKEMFHMAWHDLKTRI